MTGKAKINSITMNPIVLLVVFIIRIIRVNEYIFKVLDGLEERYF